MLENIGKRRVIQETCFWRYVLKRPQFNNEFAEFHFIDISRNCPESNGGLSCIYDVEWYKVEI